MRQPRPSDTTDWYNRRMFTDEAQSFYEQSDYYNFGIWPDGVWNPREASEQLMARLVAQLADRRGTVLDVGCGKGAACRYMSDIVGAENVVGINISERQLERCRENAPGCTFMQMDAVNLEFEDDSFDVVMCVEAAHHFKTRERYLEQALRVLKPGGTLLFTEILMSRLAEERSPYRHVENFVPSPGAYAELLQGKGFTDVDVQDVTAESTSPFYTYAMERLVEKLRTRELEQAAYIRAMKIYLASMQATRYYLLGSARKP